MYSLPHPARLLLQNPAVTLAASPVSSNDDNDNSIAVNTQFSPSMAIILVALLGVFFLMGFFSIYVRRCVTRQDGEARAGGPLQPTAATQSQGLDAAVLETLPLVIYSASKKKGSNVECVVCLTDFDEGEPLCQLPRCTHVFHKECIHMWLCSHKTCPLCRRSVLPDGSRSFRWGRSGSLRLSIGGRRGSRRESGHGSTAGPSTPEERQAGQPQVEANPNPDRIWLANAFPRSHSTGHSLAKQSDHSGELLLELDVQPRAGCLPLAAPPVVYQRSRSMAAMAAAGEGPAPFSIRAWMKRALSVKKVQPMVKGFENPQGIAAAASSARATTADGFV